MSVKLFAVTPVPLPGKGSIEGRVVDHTTKQALPGVNIIIPGTQIGAASDAKGNFKIEGIPVGIYRIKASMIGYRPSMRTEISVQSKRVTLVNLELKETVLEMEDEVMVTAEYFEKDATKPVSSFNLTPQDIRNSAGSAEDVFRILQSMPGVSTTGSVSANLIVRGGAPDENRTLLDNVEIYNPLHFARPGMSFGIISIVNPSLLKSVDFITGGFPAQYGDKMSSVFEMKLKEGNRSQFNSDYTAGIGGFGLLLDGPLPGNGNLVVSGRRGFFDYVTDMVGKPVSPRFWDFIGKATYQPWNNHQISLVGFYYADDFHKEGNLGSPPHNPEKQYYFIERHISGTAVGVNWRYLFSRKGYLRTTAAFTNNSWDEYAGNATDHNQDGDDISENEFHLKSELTYQFNRAFELKSGFFLKTIDSDHYQWKGPDTTKTGFIFPADTINYYPNPTYKTGGFLQGTVHPTNRLAINAGVRSDYFEFIDEQKTSPRLGLTYQLNDKVIFNAAYGHYYQTPSTFVIALEPENENLKSERSIHSIVGLDYLPDQSTKISVEVYQKDLENTFVEFDTTSIRTNEGSGFARGFELYIRKKMSHNFVGSLAYTYSLSRRRDGANLPLHDFEFDQRHNFTIVAGHKFKNKWRLGLKFQYSTGMPYTPVIGTAHNGQFWHLVYGEKYSQRYPDVHKLDIRIDRYFNFENWTLSVYLDLWNAYDHDNVMFYTYAVEKNGTLIQETSNDFPIMPLFGLSAQF